MFVEKARIMFKEQRHMPSSFTVGANEVKSIRITETFIDITLKHNKGIFYPMSEIHNIDYEVGD